ncbi:MAG: flagellar basal body protein [Pseudomonadota bacterium]
MAFDLKITSMARGLAAYAERRQNLVSENIANADTRRFKARDLKPFADVYEGAGAIDGARMAAFQPRATRPGHLGFEAAHNGVQAARPEAIAKLGAASPNGNTVSVEDQMTRGAEAMMQHGMALVVMKKAGEMLRMALGRAR